MILEQTRWTDALGWTSSRAPAEMPAPQLVLFFGASDAINRPTVVECLSAKYPSAALVGCSTAGEICDTHVSDDTIVATAVHFEHTAVRVAWRPLIDARNSACAGEIIARELDAEGLKHVFVLAEGVRVNGSDLVSGVLRGLPDHVAVTGGLAGDGPRFQQTTVYCGGERRHGAAVAIGFYGERLRIGYGSMGGWDAFGPDRLITRAEGNVLYELDGESAYALYKRYLGAHAASLPSSGLLFPLSLRGDAGEQRLVRTILGVDEHDGSLTFAGDMPTGGYARLMRANLDRLVDGAHGAATGSAGRMGEGSPEWAVLISCVGRKLVMKQRADEEVECVRAVLGDGTMLSGFYSYGEIAPFATSTKCELHNQTMTITTFSER